MTINTITQENVKFTLFPDGQPHVDLPEIPFEEPVSVIIRLARANDVLHLLQISEALDRLGARKVGLHISYLMAARYDRSMRKGDSFDLKIIADLINSCKFQMVYLNDVHSPVALQLIKNSENFNNRYLVESYSKPHAVLICPDAGARLKVQDYLSWNHNLEWLTVCRKSRELSTGKVTLKVIDKEVCEGRNCIIIDDICDGGATFLAIADQIKPKHLTLMVTHGIFSKGLRRLADTFDEIITTDSYQSHNPHRNLTVINKHQ